MPPAQKPLTDRFWPKVCLASPDECWLWTGAKDPNGYGRILVIGDDGKRHTRLATRVSFELANGEIGPDLYVCHRCDNPQCVNPSHLFLGSQAANMEDARKKGRIPNQETGHYQSLKTHCTRGHEYTDENTYKPPGKNERLCRECQRMHNRNFKRNKRNAHHESL